MVAVQHHLMRGPVVETDAAVRGQGEAGLAGLKGPD